MKAPRFPIIVREQSVVVKIYQVKAKTAANGFVYDITWVGPDGRRKETKAALDQAREAAQLKASQLAAGIAEGQQATRSDLLELSEARRIAGDTPVLHALGEWSKARELVGNEVLEACRVWKSRQAPMVNRLKIEDAVEKFIAGKDADGKQGEATYRSKLQPYADHFRGEYIDAILAPRLSKFQKDTWEDGVTRNDHRKRAVTLWRWAQNNGAIAEDAKLEIEKTETAKEIRRPIGIITPQVYRELLEAFRKKRPEYLAALVVAGFCGVRADEIQGKMPDRERRQLWDHIHLDRKFMSVSAAKENTPADRIVHLCPAAVAWLKLCKNRKGPVGVAKVIEKIRWLAKDWGFKLPPNCFRHSFISYRIALTGDKARTAEEAGNSVKEIDRRYRVPLPKHLGEEWNDKLMPSAA